MIDVIDAVDEDLLAWSARQEASGVLWQQGTVPPKYKDKNNQTSNSSNSRGEEVDRSDSSARPTSSAKSGDPGEVLGDFDVERSYSRSTHPGSCSLQEVALPSSLTTFTGCLLEIQDVSWDCADPPRTGVYILWFFLTIKTISGLFTAMQVRCLSFARSFTGGNFKVLVLSMFED